MTYYAFSIDDGETEAAVSRRLTKRGFTPFVPCERRRLRIGRHRREWRDEPIVPGYVFAASDGTPGWMRRVLRVWGISSVLGFGDLPAPIPAAVIMGLAEESGRKQELPRGLAIGGDARVIGGDEWSGLVGRVTDIRDTRVMLMMMMFGAEREVEIDASKLEAA